MEFLLIAAAILAILGVYLWMITVEYQESVQAADAFAALASLLVGTIVTQAMERQSAEPPTSAESPEETEPTP